MNSYATISAQIKVILLTASNVGLKVYEYDRLESDEAGFKSAFLDTTSGYIRAWTITRTAVVEINEASRRNKVISTWTIRGYHSFQEKGDNLESTFQLLIDNIRGKFRENPSVNSTVETSDPLQVSPIEPRLWGEVLCHYTEMRLTTYEEVTY